MYPDKIEQFKLSVMVCTTMSDLNIHVKFLPNVHDIISYLRPYRVGLCWPERVKFKWRWIKSYSVCWTGVDGFQNDPVIHVGNDQKLRRPSCS